MKFYTVTLCLFVYSLSGFCQVKHNPIYQSPAFSVYPDKVVQDDFHAIAISRTHIQTNYRSAANEFLSPRIDFKFSINGKDNEMISGRDHHFNFISDTGECETPLVIFGQQHNDSRPLPPAVYLKPDSKLTLKLDMRGVFNDFETRGYFEAFNGSRVYKNDFKGVFVAGGTSPMTWDFDNLHNFKDLQLHDEDGDHIYELTLLLNSQSALNSPSPDWQLSTDIKPYPQYLSDYVLTDALYNLALEEMVRAVEKDSTLRTGKAWAGVWTRDVSYSIILSMAILQPKVAMYSLMRKVQNGVIVQDTGTGGAYPISTDRMIWAVAAWEIFKVTGDHSWLERTYPIIKKSLEADLANVIDPGTGLVKGESSFLDWREQTYPDWMQPADIFESQCLGTNAVHFKAHSILAEMAELLKERGTAEKHRQQATTIRQAINKHLWIADRKYYGQFLYGRNFDLLSPKSEALGEALCVLYDIADTERQKQVVENTPVNAFGIPCIYPQIPNIPPYHNNAVWPFVQSYWALAAAKAGNEESVVHSIASIIRPAALFLTNKENFVAMSGDYASTQINSDNMLWSLSGNIAMIYKILFGMQFETDGLVLQPFVPEHLAGTRTLSNFRYRNAQLKITLTGFGNKIKSVTLDGKRLVNAKIPGALEGKHTVEIILANNKVGGDENIEAHHVAPETPIVNQNGSKISWNKVRGAVKYRVIVNGAVVSTRADTTFNLPGDQIHECQVIAFDAQGFESFASEPLHIAPEKEFMKVEAEQFTNAADILFDGFSGKGYVRTDINGHKTIHFTLPVSESGMYALDFRYANGNGPVNTENKCAIRSLFINDKKLSTVVLPQRGKEEWSDWGFTNVTRAELSPGEYKITLTFEEANANMNGEINEAAVDYLRVVRID